MLVRLRQQKSADVCKKRKVQKPEKGEKRPAHTHIPPVLHALVFRSVWLTVKLIMDYSGEQELLLFFHKNKARMKAIRG